MYLLTRYTEEMKAWAIAIAILAAMWLLMAPTPAQAANLPGFGLYDIPKIATTSSASIARATTTGALPVKSFTQSDQEQQLRDLIKQLQALIAQLSKNK